MTAVLQGNPIYLVHGVTYRARGRVDAPKALTTDATITQVFEDTGFADVRVWRDANTLPANWPADQRQEIGGGLLGGWTVFLEGTWNGADGSLPRPEPLLAVWEADQTNAAAAATPATPGVVTLPEITVYGSAPEGPAKSARAGAIAVACVGSVLLWIALRWGHDHIA